MCRMTRLSIALALAVAGFTGVALAAPAALANAAHHQQVETGSISGTVLDAAGNAVVGAKVLLFHHQGHHPAAATEPAKHPHRETVTDATGHFSFDKVHPGKHLLVAHLVGTGHGHAVDELKAGATDTVSITLHKKAK